MSSTAREVRTGGSDPAGGEAASLVESAMLLRWRAPELTLLLADRAVTAAQDDKMAGLRADHLAVFALNRLGRHGEAAHRLIPAIRDTDTPQPLRHELNVELAHCAAALGEPATALGAVRAVLAAGDDVAPALRGRALVAVAEASIALGRDDLVSSALEEADELYREDQSLDHDTALLLRAAVRATDAARHRARGAAEEAEAKAREGRELLTGLADPDQDSGEVSARLMLVLALTLLDRGAGETATQEVRPLLRRQVRAAAAGAVGRLRLALAAQVHLAEGRHEPALTLLADAVEGAQRYGVDMVLAECLEGLSHVHEARGEFADALHCMRAACAAEGRHRREVAAARSVLLENCGSARREEARLIGQVAELLANAGSGCARLDAETAETDTAETEVPKADALETEIAVAEAAEGEVGEVEVAGGNVAVVEVVEAQTPQPGTPPLEPAAASISLEEHNAVVQDADSPGGLDSWHSRARHSRSEAETLVSVSDLLPASVLPAGRSGRRRAGEPVDERSAAAAHQIEDDGPEEGREDRRRSTDGPDVSLGDDIAGSAPAEGAERIPATRREFSASGPPPAPTPRALEWEPDGDPAENDETPKMGLGDLLAEALAAYQESRDVHTDARPAGTLGNDVADAVTIRDLPRYRGPGTRWTAGLALAPNLSDHNVSDHNVSDPTLSDPTLSDEDRGEPSEAITNPLLRLPELTAEPRWIPPEKGRRSAAGD
ncbi:MAG: hypothetical protein ACRDRA_15460 [Pseudonocardiaceae bacterium]